ncbi:MAG: hypothetical protein E4G98_00970 [Promethearchaeota archaeon]|nr:MAG: hypothetical protein E4G98_00970 [Candidatus Lokiarchaeota archaeon]
MVLSWKHRTFLVGIVLFCNIASLVLSSVSQNLENSITYREAYFFEGDQYVDFDFYNASSQTTHKLRLEGVTRNDTHTQVSLISDSELLDQFYVNPYGWMYLDGNLQEYVYSVWWIYVPNVFVFFGIQEGDEFQVIDPSGFFGPRNQNYTYIVEDKFVFYPYLPQHVNLSGAQASFEASLFSTPANKKIGTFLFDTTSGAMEQADFHVDGSMYQLFLTETSYGISRNRYVLIGINFFLGLTIMMILWLSAFLKRKRDKKTFIPLDPELRQQFFSILGAGFVSNVLGVIDTWFYHSVGLTATVLIDLGFALLLSIICIRGKYGVKWVLPSLLELIYAKPLRGRLVIPFIGNFLAWIAVVWASGVITPQKSLLLPENIHTETEPSETGPSSKLDQFMEGII